MKAGHLNRFFGRHSCTVAALVLTTIFLWAGEKNPIFISLLSSEERLRMYTPDLSVADFDSSVLNSKEQHTEEYSHSLVMEDTVEDASIKHSDSAVKDIPVLPSPERVDESTILDSFVNKQGCNYAKGKWVSDSRRPLYSGFGCKQWLSDMWACRLTRRTDFSYEGYRWQPDNCEMRDFEGSKFLKRMQDKTIAFIGDSLGRQQFQSLLCMVSGGVEKPDVEDVGWKYGLVKPRGAVRPDGWAYWFPDTNTTILYYWSASLCGIQPINITDPATEFAMHLDQPPAFLSQFLAQFHVVILNTGHHWNRAKLRANRWVMHANGNPVTDRKLAEIGNAKNYTIYSIARWLDSQIPLHPGLEVFFRTISPRHFLNGDWNTGGSCDNTIPLSRGSEVLQDESSDLVIEGAIRGTKVKILDITAISELRDEGHISRYSIKASDGINDCLHWCLPGIPDTWNELLYSQL